MQEVVGIEIWAEGDQRAEAERKRQLGHVDSAPGAGTGPNGSAPGAGPEGTDPILAEIRARIERVKKYPELASRMGITGKVLIRFSINQQGQPADLSIGESSGSELLDQAALSTIKQAAPYPAYSEKLLIWINYHPVL